MIEGIIIIRKVQYHQVNTRSSQNHDVLHTIRKNNVNLWLHKAPVNL